MQLKQQGKVTDQQDSIDNLVCKISLLNKYKASCHINDLKEETTVGVKLFNPTTLLDARRSAKL